MSPQKFEGVSVDWCHLNLKTSNAFTRLDLESKVCECKWTLPANLKKTQTEVFLYILNLHTIFPAIWKRDRNKLVFEKCGALFKFISQKRVHMSLEYFEEKLFATLWTFWETKNISHVLSVFFSFIRRISSALII